MRIAIRDNETDLIQKALRDKYVNYEINLAELGRRAGVSRESVRMYAAGLRPLSRQVLDKWAKSMGVKPSADMFNDCK